MLLCREELARRRRGERRTHRVLSGHDGRDQSCRMDAAWLPSVPVAATTPGHPNCLEGRDIVLIVMALRLVTTGRTFSGLYAPSDALFAFRCGKNVTTTNP